MKVRCDIRWRKEKQSYQVGIVKSLFNQFHHITVNKFKTCFVIRKGWQSYPNFNCIVIDIDLWYPSSEVSQWRYSNWRTPRFILPRGVSPAFQIRKLPQAHLADTSIVIFPPVYDNTRIESVHPSILQVNLYIISLQSGKAPITLPKIHHFYEKYSD